MAPRYSRPRLIDDQDRQYRAFLEKIALGRQNRRAIRPPRARDLFGGEAEQALRGWLAERLPLSDRRIVEYLEHIGRTPVKKYRELDATAIPDPKTVHVFEIKASQKATSLLRARRQLSETRAILGMLFPRVVTTIMLVDTGIPKTPADAAELAAQLAAMRPDRDPPPPPPTLDEVLAEAPTLRLVGGLDEQLAAPEVTGVLRFSVEDVVALAGGAENLHLDWDEPEEDEAEEPELERHTFTAGGGEGEEDESPLAAALRRAMEGNG